MTLKAAPSPAPGCLIGADEAGYGPNLGPLIVSVTRWNLPCEADGCDLWRELKLAVCGPKGSRNRLQIADSKALYQPGQIAVLERGVLALLAVAGVHPRSWSELRAAVVQSEVSPGCGTLPDDFAAPWYAEEEIALPLAADPDDVARAAELLERVLGLCGIALAAIRSDIVTEPRFNRLATAAQSKGAALTEVTLGLIRSVWSGPETSTLVIGDKHGGRNRYAGAIQTITDGRFVTTLEESRACSRYTTGGTEFRFEAGGERHLPVAAASMVSKYVREVAMLAVNAFWRRHRPDLKPTQGYPQDAVRFRREIADVQLRLGLPDHLLWRVR